MRALVMTGFGPAGNATIGELPEPEPRPGNLLVKLAAAAVNPVDWKEMAGHLTGFYGDYGGRWAPGFDGSGIVEAIGAGVTDFAPGDRVVLLSDRREGQSGTFAEYARVPARLAAKAPASIGWGGIASLPTAGATGWQGLFRAGIEPLRAGESVVIHGASGGIGSFSIGFAHAIGADVAATARDVNLDYLRGLGADRAIDYRNEDVVAAVREWRPEGVDRVLDCTSGGRQTELLDMLRPGGHLVVVATVTDDADMARLADAAQLRDCRATLLILNLADLREDLEGMMRLIDEGRMALPELTAYPLDRAGDALATMQAGGVRGKLVIDIAAL